MSKNREVLTQVKEYLRAHHTMTIATRDPQGGAPHAACVFYAVGKDMHLVFLSKPDSVHGAHIGQEAPVAVTITEEYSDWRSIRGVQLWGMARRLEGGAKARALALYVRAFPFVSDLMRQPELGSLFSRVGVYEVRPCRAAFTDNTTGVFGREMVEFDSAEG